MPINFLQPKSSNNRPTLLRVFFIVLAVTLTASVLAVTAGSLTPPGSPASTMHTLQEIYDSIAGTFSSALITSSTTGSVIQGLKYIQANLFVASSSQGFYFTPTTRFVGIGTTNLETALEVNGTASVSALLVNGSPVSGSNPRPASNSLDWDEFVNSMALDADTSIASQGFTLSFTDTPIRFFETSPVHSAPIFIHAAFPSINLETVGGSAGIVWDLPGSDWSLVSSDSSGEFFGVGRGISSPKNLSFNTNRAFALSTIGSGLRFTPSTASMSHSSLFVQQTSGNVGIYDDSPDARLEVVATGSFDLLDLTSFGGTSGDEFKIDVAGNASISGNFGPRTTNTFDLGSSINRWRAIYVSSSSLHIGTNGNEAVIGYGSGSFQGLLLKPNGTTTTAFFADGGPVGFGTSTPDQKLDVAGNILASTSGHVDLILRTTSATGTDQGLFTLRAGTNERFSIMNGSGVAVVNIASGGQFIDLASVSITGQVRIGGQGLSFLRTDGGPRATLLHNSSDTFVFSEPVVTLGGVYGNSAYDSTLERLAVGFGGSAFSHTGTTVDLLTIQTSGGNLTANILAGKVGGSTRFAFNASASLGIGDSTPDARLEVVASQGFDLLQLSGTAAGNGNRLIVKNSGNVGIASTSPSEKLVLVGNAFVRGHTLTGNSGVIDEHTAYLGSGYSIPIISNIQNRFTDLATTNVFDFGQAIGLVLDPATTASDVIYGQQSFITTEPTNTKNYTGAVIGVSAYFQLNSPGSVAQAVGLTAQAQANDGIITSASAGQFSIDGTGTGRIRTGTGIEITTPVDTSRIGSLYGLFINDQSGGATKSYNIFSEGSGRNYFGGNVGIGAASPTSRLTVFDPVNSTVARIGSTSAQSFLISRSGVAPVWLFSATEARGFAFTGNGNYGIGSAAPSDRFHVNLSSTFSSEVRLADTLQVANSGATVSYSRFGTGATTHSLSAASDLLLSSILEVDGQTFLDANASISGNLELFGTGSTTGAVASISAISLTTGTVLSMTVPASTSSSARYLLVRDTNGVAYASLGNGGRLALARDIRSDGATSNCTGVNTPSQGCIDYAESFPTNDQSISAGDIVAVVSTPVQSPDGNHGTGNSGYVKKADKDSVVLGIVSTNPGVLLTGTGVLSGSNTTREAPKNTVPIALAGRVPVKVSGSVKAGDHLTVSDIPGVSSKAVKAGMTVGIALESTDNSQPTTGYQTILVFVNTGYWMPTVEPTTNNQQPTTGGFIDSVISKFSSMLDIVFEKGLLRIANIISEKLTTKQLCVDDVCVTRDQLKALLEKNGLTPAVPPEPMVSPSPSVSDAPSADLSPTPSLAPETTPEPTPSVPPETPIAP